MTNEQLNIYNQAQRRVKLLESNVSYLAGSIERDDIIPFQLDGCNLDIEVGNKVMRYALNLCKQELVKAQEEFNGL